MPKFTNIANFIINKCVSINYFYGYTPLSRLYNYIYDDYIIYSNFDNIKNTYVDVFTYQPTFTSVVLHITYMLMIGALLIEYRALRIL